MKTLSFPSKIVAIVVATLLALMGILPFLSSSKAFAEEADLEASGLSYDKVQYTGETISLADLHPQYNNSQVVFPGEDDPAATAESADKIYRILDGSQITGTDADTYTVTLLKLEKKHSGPAYYYQSTGPQRTGKWTIDKCVIPVPTAVEGLVYNGDWQCGIVLSDQLKMAIEEQAVEVKQDSMLQTNAGAYMTEFYLHTHLNTNYEWAADAAPTSLAGVSKCVDWTIEQATAVVDQAAVKWVKGSKDGVVLTSSGLYADCEQIAIANEKGWSKVLYGEGVEVEGIEVTEGSTVLTASAAALETLAAGEYTITYTYNTDNYTAETAAATLTVVEPTVAKTGDNAALIAMAGLALVAAAGAGIALSMKRREN